MELDLALSYILIRFILPLILGTGMSRMTFYVLLKNIDFHSFRVFNENFDFKRK